MKLDRKLKREGRLIYDDSIIIEREQHQPETKWAECGPSVLAMQVMQNWEDRQIIIERNRAAKISETNRKRWEEMKRAKK